MVSLTYFLLGKQAYFFFIHVCFGDIDRSGCGLLDGQSFSPFAFALKLSFQCTLSVTTGLFFLGKCLKGITHMKYPENV
uniref:Uncharacterized protein n=1 Tax=Cucumis sativus TaxID=3659 RepID=A0A0A0KRG4_CUCSA